MVGDDDEEDEEFDSEDDGGDDTYSNENKKEPLKSTSQSGSCIYTAIYDFNAEQEGDLSVKVKCFLQLTDILSVCF